MVFTSSKLIHRFMLTIFGFFISSTVIAQTALEEVIVTAQKRAQNIQDVPISIASLSGQRLESMFSGGESILAVASSTPGLYAESSNGRSAPRLYMRGLGNADFDQAASQPVSLVFDNVPIEAVALKSFPIFDVDRVEVIRGPQGTLFGRNTTAGIVKIDTRRPTEEFEGYAKINVGNIGAIDAEGAVGGSLKKGVLSTRFSFKSTRRADWIDNGFTGQDDFTGGIEDYAARIQFLWTPTDTLTAHFLGQFRRARDNTASKFRANILTTGSNELNSNFDRDTVFYNGGGSNAHELEGYGGTLTVDWEVGDYTITSITSLQVMNQRGRGDIDGGNPTGPGFIPFQSDTGSQNNPRQFTQEVRLLSDLDGRFNYQVGVFYFDDELETTTDFGAGPAAFDLFRAAIAGHKNTSWAIFGQGDYELTDKITLTAGIRYTDDDKDYIPVRTPNPQAPINLSDTNVSGNITLAYQLDDDSQVYARFATGFRAPSIQARNAAFGGAVTTADSETINSFEVGYKADLWGKVRVNSALFYYDISDMQLTALGGTGNNNTLLNADEGIGYGGEIDIEWLVTENLILSGGFGYNKTEINDDTLAVGRCGSGQCTILNPFDANGNVLIDGNPFQHAPKWTANVELSYTHPLSNDTELFLYTDWKIKGETVDFLYRSIEYTTDTQFEGGLRAGYRDNSRGYSIGIFARNITDEENLIGGIDFNNNTGYVNEPRIYGVEASYNF